MCKYFRLSNRPPHRMMVEYLQLRQTNVVVVVVMHNPDHPVTCARLHSLTFTYIIASLREGNLLNIEMSD